MAQSACGRALTYLERDPLLHTGMIEALRRDRAELLYGGGDGVLLRETGSGALMLSAATPEAGERLTRGMDGASLFLVHRKDCVPALVKRFKFKNILDCLQAVYTGNYFLPLSEKYTASPLGPEYAEAVLSQYCTMDAGYVRGRLESRALFGAFSGGRLAGFAGLHEEGSIGMLEVLPEYRRMGVGSFLERFMINLNLREGWTPYCQILDGNTASLALQKKLGLELSESHLYWLF